MPDRGMLLRWKSDLKYSKHLAQDVPWIVSHPKSNRMRRPNQWVDNELNPVYESLVEQFFPDCLTNNQIFPKDLELSIFGKKLHQPSLSWPHLQLL